MNLFDTLPGSFFNCLASGSTNRVYADCLLLIYHEYDREITYRIPRSQVRDALAVYLMEHQVEKLEDEPEENTNYNEMANACNPPFLLPGSGVAGGGHRRCHL